MSDKDAGGGGVSEKEERTWGGGGAGRGERGVLCLSCRNISLKITLLKFARQLPDRITVQKLLFCVF